MFPIINQALVGFTWGVSSKPIGAPRGGIINVQSESRAILVCASSRLIDVLPGTGGYSVANIERFTKQPKEVFDYRINLEDWLDAGDVAVDVEIESDAGITVDSSSVDDGGVTIWVSGGTTEVDYNFSVLIETDEGRKKEVDFIIRVREYGL